MTTDLPFLDTNILIRHLTADHPEQSPRCRTLLMDLEAGTRRAWTSHLVVAEVVFVLARVYQLERQEIADVVLPLVELVGLRIAGKRVFRRVFDLYTSTGLTYPDCYHAALVERSGDRRVISFDQGFDRLSFVERIEP